MSKNKVWIPVSHKLPPVKTRVELKRDLSVGTGGFTGLEKLEWVSTGRYSYLRDKVVWSIKMADGVTLGNTIPTHWRTIT